MKHWTFRILLCLLLGVAGHLVWLLLHYPLTAVPGQVSPTELEFISDNFFTMPAVILVPFGITLVGLSSWLFRDFRHRRARRSAGECLGCGYDLRGEFENGCPECGWNRNP